MAAKIVAKTQARAVHRKPRSSIWSLTGCPQLTRIWLVFMSISPMGWSGFPVVASFCVANPPGVVVQFRLGPACFSSHRLRRRGAALAAP